jgi:methionyl-tRNA formyltransferase
MRVVFLASGAFAQPTLRWLAQSPHEVALVVTQPAKGSGRGRHVTRMPVRALADELGLETLEAEDVNAPDVIGRLRSLEARVGLVIAFGQKLGPELLGIMPGGCINLHASLLPKYRGAAPINWAVVRGDEKTGCTVFRITERMDAGPILVSRWTEIKPEETAGELHDRLAGIGVDAMKAAVELFEGDDVPAGTPQDEREATPAPKLSKTDGVVDFDRPASDVAHHICGMTPWPGASARFEASDDRWENVTFLRARRAQDPYAPADPPGTIDARRYVAARDGFVEILEIKPSSGRSMTWQDYVNGRHVSPGDRFTTP